MFSRGKGWSQEKGASNDVENSFFFYSHKLSLLKEFRKPTANVDRPYSTAIDKVRPQRRPDETN